MVLLNHRMPLPPGNDHAASKRMRSASHPLHNRISGRLMGGDSRLKHRANTVETVNGIVSAFVV